MGAAQWAAPIGFGGKQGWRETGWNTSWIGEARIPQMLVLHIME